MLKNGDLIPVEIARIGNPRAADRIAEPISSMYSISPLSSAAMEMFGRIWISSTSEPCFE